MKLKERLFRNPAVEFLMIVGMSVSCFILLNIADLYYKISIEDKSNGFQSSAEYILDTSALEAEFYSSEESTLSLKDLYMEIAESAGSVRGGNSFLVIKEFSIDKAIKGRRAYVVMAENEPMDLKLAESCGKPEEIKNSIVIGESLKKYVHSENGENYINTGVQKLNVSGILKNNMAGGVDNTVYIFWNTCDPELKEYLIGIWSAWVPGVILNSEYGIEAVKNEFLEKMEGKSVTCEPVDRDYIGDYQNEWYRTFNSIFLAVGMIFSVFTCFGISYLWISRRNKELAIRRANGYSTGMLAALILKDMAKLTGISLVISFCLHLALSLLTDASGITLYMLLMRLAVILAGMAVVVLLNVAHVLGRVRLVNPASVGEEN